MAVLNIRGLSEDVLARLRKRAARKRRSVEAEARDIITRAVATEDVAAAVKRIQAYVDRFYRGRKPKRVVESLIAERRKAARRGE
jgi:plasmid stability protein